MVIDQWKIGYPRGARNVSKSADVSITTYPDDKTLIVPANAPKLQPIVDFVKKRNKDPELQRKKPVIQFEWERVF